MDPLNSSPIASGSQMPPQQLQEKPKSSVGALAGAAIIILLLVAGGLYYWGAVLSTIPEPEAVPYIPSNDTSGSVNTTIEADANVGLPPQSTSDDAAAIEADLNAMDLNSIDSANSAELNNI